MSAPAEVQVTVGDQPVALTTVCRRGPMNFGQNWRGVPMVEARYTLRVPTAQVVAAVDALRAEFRADAERFPDADDALEQAWRRLGWAAGAVAVADADFLWAFVDFQPADVLDDALGVSPATPVWFLNTVDGAELHGAHVVLTGVAGRRA